MNLDLNTLLEGWPHESGQIRVRKIKGIDGKDKIQLRIDLGLIQMETAGRPDGARPHGCESLLHWHRRRARRALAAERPFSLNADECGDLQQEAIQYYHRYVALFELGDFESVVQDTERNLDLFSFVTKYAQREEFAWSLEQFRPYVMMMRTRARASLNLERNEIPAAIKEVESGRNKIIKFLKERPEPTDTSAETEFLSEWLEELQSKRPLTKLEVMQREMDQAIATEAYERAAQLRDAIRDLRESKAK